MDWLILLLLEDQGCGPTGEACQEDCENAINEGNGMGDGVNPFFHACFLDFRFQGFGADHLAIPQEQDLSDVFTDGNIGRNFEVHVEECTVL